MRSPDVATNRTDYHSILYVQFRGVMTGYTNGNFGPDDTIKRAEISAILTRARLDELTINICRVSSFPDVDVAEWYGPYVCAAKNAQFVSGYPDGNFRPGQAISAAEISKIMALGFALPVTTTAYSAELWYMPYVDALVSVKAFPATPQSGSESIARRGGANACGAVDT